MTLEVKKITETDWKSYELSRYMVDDHISCHLVGGYQHEAPQRGTLYNVKIVDLDNDTTIEKLAIFGNYNYVVDKDGDSAPVVCDNSFNFQVVG